MEPDSELCAQMQYSSAMGRQNSAQVDGGHEGAEEFFPRGTKGDAGHRADDE